MPPYTPSFVNYGNDSDGHRNSLGLGFTSPLLDTISKSKSKIQDWVDYEKSKMDSKAESYRETLMEQETIIKSQVAELAIVQRERGMDDEMVERVNENDDDDHRENIAVQKQSLEEQSAKVRIDIMKLKTERDNRARRVQDISLEESKQRMRASDAAALKRSAEESKKTTIDDLTRGVVNYKKLGLDFTQMEQDSGLKLNFTEIDPDDPSKNFSFVLLVNDDEKYDIANCNPQIDAMELEDILEELNESGGEDISILARRMRRAFKEVCAFKDVRESA